MRRRAVALRVIGKLLVVAQRATIGVEIDGVAGTEFKAVGPATEIPDLVRVVDPIDGIEGEDHCLEMLEP